MTSVNSVNSSSGSISSVMNNSAVMDKDGFLNLFLASLQYQDPSSPMETAEMMSQLSQLGNMEAVQNMTNAVEDLKKLVNEMSGGLDKGASYLGKEIVGMNSEGEAVQGIVDSVYTDSEQVYLVVEGQRLLINQVAMISNPNVQSNVNTYVQSEIE